MNIKVSYIIIGILVLISPVKGQSKTGDISVTLEKLYDRILYTNIDAERLRLNDSVKLLIDSYVTSDSAFTHNFTNLRYLGQITSPDKQLKIINWNLILRNGSNKYFFYMIRKGAKGKGNQIYKLAGEHKEKTVRTDIEYNSENWYGALYYAIQPFKKDKQVNYILLGIDVGNSQISRKIIEVLSFTPGGEIVFGKNCFKKENEIKSREVLEYFSEGVMTLRLNSKNMIVFDHLVSFSDDQKNNPESYGAEYTYDSYIYRKGLWQFTKNVDVRNIKKRTR
jgi:homoaconitase/3-isopropylmalate dehydratase large subunit